MEKTPIGTTRIFYSVYTPEHSISVTGNTLNLILSHTSCEIKKEYIQTEGHHF